MSILTEIAAKTRLRVAEQKQRIPFALLKETIARTERAPLPFADLFRHEGLHVIAEIKRASPSLGFIAPDLDPIQVADAYLTAGARALSILTEPHYFKGDIAFLKAIREKYPAAPLLMKDFFLDAYQVAQARALGADAILVIVAMLGEEESGRLMQCAHELNLTPLVEVHDEDELAIAVRLKAPLIGINNRNLGDLSLSLETTRRLLAKMPDGITVICESGLKTREELLSMRKLGCHGFLIGTALMAGKQPGTALSALLA